MSNLRPRTLIHSHWGGCHPQVKEMIRQNQERPMLERLGYILTEPSDLYESLKQQVSSAEGVEPYLVSEMKQYNASRSAIAWDKNQYNQYTCSMIQQALQKWRHDKDEKDRLAEIATLKAAEETANREMKEAIAHKITMMMPKCNQEHNIMQTVRRPYHHVRSVHMSRPYGSCPCHKTHLSTEDSLKTEALLRMANDRSMITEQMKQSALSEYRLHKEQEKAKAEAKIAAAKQHEEQVKAQMTNVAASW
jgi:hypothetical protein